MSAIAYITDNKMLELHRLNANKTMNFWRLSNKLSFSDFAAGDLLFFLSKDRRDMKNKEKGIVGYGRVVSMQQLSLNYMWRKYRKLNGYNSFKEFKEAIARCNKNAELPELLSSFYLEDVTFFQVPVYLSECGIEISNRLESYLYLKDERVVMKLLDHATKALDIWSSDETALSKIENQRLIIGINYAHRQIGDPHYDKRIRNRADRHLRKMNGWYRFKDSATDIYRLENGQIHIMMYIDKEIDIRMVLGQAQFYRRYAAQLNLGRIKFSLYGSSGEMSDL